MFKSAPTAESLNVKVSYTATHKKLKLQGIAELFAISHRGSCSLLPLCHTTLFAPL